MWLIKLLSLFFFYISLVSSANFFISTGVPEIPMISADVPSIEHVQNLQNIINETFNTPSMVAVENFIRRALAEIPFIRIALNYSSDGGLENLFGFLNAPEPGNGCQCDHIERVPIRNFQDWRSVIGKIKCNKLHISVSRESIIQDAARSYKDLDLVPNFAAHHLWYRNIKVQMEIGEDQGGPRNDFFTLFFDEIINKSPYFHKNPEGYVVVSPGKTSLNDFDVYEAFGFYLAKAVQNNFAIDTILSKVIVDMIRFGKILFFDTKLIESWDLEVANSLRQMALCSEEVLSGFDFNMICESFPSMTCTSSNLEVFQIEKIRRILRDFNSQLIMVSLGFIRACPPHVVSELIDLNSHLLGAFNLTPRELLLAYITNNEQSNHIAFRTFARWLQALAPEQFRTFFRYATGLMTLPKEGFASIQPQPTFALEDSGNEDNLPYANTCLRRFYMPRYLTEEETLQKLNHLMTLIESGEAYGFGLA